MAPLDRGMRGTRRGAMNSAFGLQKKRPSFDTYISRRTAMAALSWRVFGDRDQANTPSRDRFQLLFKRPKVDTPGGLNLWKLKAGERGQELESPERLGQHKIPNVWR